MLQRTETADRGEPPSAEEGTASPLSAVDLPGASASIVLTSGRRYDLAAGPEADRLTVRGRGGEVVLRVEITERGPVLSFTSAEVTLTASKTLRLAADRVAIEAGEAVTVETPGALTERLGAHHTQVAREERLEAGSIEVQSNDSHLHLRARRRIALDADQVGLNDDPCPAPFDWSAPAREGSS